MQLTTTTAIIIIINSGTRINSNSFICIFYLFFARHNLEGEKYFYTIKTVIKSLSLLNLFSREVTLTSSIKAIDFFFEFIVEESQIRHRSVFHAFCYKLSYRLRLFPR